MSRPEPGEAGSSVMGCISFTVRVAPIGSADDGAIDSECTNNVRVWKRGKQVAKKLTFAYAQEGELAERDDRTAGRKASVKVCIADH